MKIICLDTIDSTQKYAISAIRNGDFINDDNILVYTKKQTNGVGRSGEQWIMYDGNLAMSLVMKLNFEQNLPFSIIVGYILAQLFNKNHNISVKIKWPNDLMLNDAKLGGMITNIEKHENFCYYIFGIGLNLIENPQNLEYEAVNILQYSKQKTDSYLLAKNISRLIINQIFTTNLQDIDDYTYKIGQIAKINNISGMFCGISENGAAKIMTNNKITEVFSGKIILS